MGIKLKKTKVKKRYFNYLIIRDQNQKVSLEQRTGRGIWQNLYQFPLIETNKSLNLEELKERPELEEHVNKYVSIELFNGGEIVHKLSHQHLYTKFWIIEAEHKKGEPIHLSEVKKYPLPTLISNFVNEFESSY